MTFESYEDLTCLIQWTQLTSFQMGMSVELDWPSRRFHFGDDPLVPSYTQLARNEKAALDIPLYFQFPFTTNLSEASQVVVDTFATLINLNLSHVFFKNLRIAAGELRVDNGTLRRELHMGHNNSVPFSQLTDQIIQQALSTSSRDTSQREAPLQCDTDWCGLSCPGRDDPFEPIDLENTSVGDWGVIKRSVNSMFTLCHWYFTSSHVRRLNFTIVDINLEPLKILIPEFNCLAQHGVLAFDSNYDFSKGTGNSSSPRADTIRICSSSHESWWKNQSFFETTFLTNSTLISVLMGHFDIEIDRYFELKYTVIEIIGDG